MLKKAFDKAKTHPRQTSIYTRRAKLLEFKTLPESHLFELVYFHFFIGSINIKAVKWFIQNMKNKNLKDLILLDSNKFITEPIKTQFYILKLKDQFTFEVLTKHSPEVRKLLK